MNLKLLKNGKKTEDTIKMKYCTGCDKSEKEIMEEQNCTEEELDNCSLTLNCGAWYCHDDCFHDSH
jgi:hypothetical protein